MRRLRTAFAYAAGGHRPYAVYLVGVTRVGFQKGARSSVGEHPLHTRGVVGSIPTVPITCLAL